MKLKWEHLARAKFVLIFCVVHCAQGSTHLDRSPLASFAEPILLSSLDHNSTSVVPLFYGWFFNETIAESMSIIGKKYFLQCYDTIPQFQVFVDELMHENNITNPLEFYVKPVDPSSHLQDMRYHTTAIFCGRNDTTGQCTSYLHEVGQYLGRPYRIHFVGLFFTRKTYGIRVKLTSDEQKLFRMDDRENSAQVSGVLEVSKNANQTGEGIAYEPYYKSKDLRNKVTHPFYPEIEFLPQKENFHPTESRAHVTLGCAPKIGAEQTGFDLLEIIDLEVSSYSYHQDFLIGGKEIPKATLRQFNVIDEMGTRAFVLYPEEEMIAEAMFDAYL